MKAVTEIVGEPGDAALAEIAAYFSLLADPERLRLVSMLRGRKRSLGEFSHLTGRSPADLKSDLELLVAHRVVHRMDLGPLVFFELGDSSIHVLWDVICERVVRRHEAAAALSSSELAPHLLQTQI